MTNAEHFISQRAAVGTQPHAVAVLARSIIAFALRAGQRSAVTALDGFSETIRSAVFSKALRTSSAHSAISARSASMPCPTIVFRSKLISNNVVTAAVWASGRAHRCAGLHSDLIKSKARGYPPPSSARVATSPRAKYPDGSIGPSAIRTAPHPRQGRPCQSPRR